MISQGTGAGPAHAHLALGSIRRKHLLAQLDESVDGFLIQTAHGVRR